MEGNSFKERKMEEEKEERKFDPVVKGDDVKIKQQSAVKKAARSFLAEDVNSVKSYLLNDVFVPALKDTIVDMVQNGIEMLVKGGTSGSSRRYGRSKDRESYTRYYDDKYRDRERERDKESYRSRSRDDIYDEDDVTFRTKAAAKEVKERMCEIIDRYDSVSVSNMYDLLDKSCHNYLAASWGWDSIEAIANAPIERTYDGWYLLVLPRVKYLR